MTVEMPAELSINLLEKILKTTESDETISIVNAEVNSATQKGDNYSSNIYRIKIEFIRNCENQETQEIKTLIVKVALTFDEKHKNRTDGFFRTEIAMMTSILNKMQMLLDDVKLYAKCFYSYDGTPEFLIIEDLQTLGYRMFIHDTGLDLQHSLLAIKGLAKFHASSVAVCEKNPECKSITSKGANHMDKSSALGNMITLTIKYLAESVATWPGIDGVCGEKLLKLSDVIFDKMIKLKQPVESEFNVINHGDFWRNNMLFRYDEQMQAVAHTFVDFQISAYTSPALDLQYFLNSSLSEAVSINHEDELIFEYHRTLCETMRKIDCKISPPTLDDLMRSMKKFWVFGLLGACLVLPVMFRRKEDARSWNEIIDQNGGVDHKKFCEFPKYRAAVSRRLRHWNEMGLLDN